MKDKTRNATQTKRLLNVAVALEEATDSRTSKAIMDGTRPQFTMHKYNHFCGAPACALGHFAARADLQKLLVIKGRAADEPGPYGGMLLEAYMAYRSRKDEPGCSADHGDAKVLDYFGLDSIQASELFAPGGCGRAATAKQAAKYIRKFVKKNPTYLKWDR